MLLQTEYSFTLPCGFIDAQGTLHREGTMRRATALDEVEPLGDARVRANEAYLSILVLSRVVNHIGSVRPITPGIIESLFSADFLFLQDLYLRINESTGTASSEIVETACPKCGTHFALDLSQQAGEGTFHE